MNLLDRIEISGPESRRYATIRTWHNPSDVIRVYDHFETRNGIQYDPAIDAYYDVRSEVANSLFYPFVKLFPQLYGKIDAEGLQFIKEEEWEPEFLEKAEKRKVVGKAFSIWTIQVFD